MKILLFGVLLCLTISILSGIITIPILRKIKAKQPIYKYVDMHKEKNGTPTMGGLFFILPSVILFLFLRGENSFMALISLAIGLSFMVVGFIDDFIKIKFEKNEGLKPYQKIIFQISLSFRRLPFLLSLR